MLSLILATALSFAHADDTQTIRWPKSLVVCAGTVDGQQLNMRVSVKNEVLTADSDRFIVFINLAKPARVHWLVAEVLSDADYEKREQIASKLPQEEAELIRELTPSRQTEMYSGFTDGFAHFNLSNKKHKLSLSCKETSLQTTPPKQNPSFDSALQPVEDSSKP